MKIFIEESFGSQMVKIFAIDRRGTKDVAYHYDGENMVCSEFEAMNPISNEIKPMLEMPYSLFKEFSTVFVEKMAESGTKTPDVKVMEGKMEAQALHLSDARTANAKMLDALIQLAMPSISYELKKDVD